MKLTPQQIDTFNREGWLFLPELFSAEEVAYLAREAEGIYDADRPEVWREKSGAPRTGLEAKFDARYVVALSLHGRTLAAGDFGEPLADDPAVRATASMRRWAAASCCMRTGTGRRATIWKPGVISLPPPCGRWRPPAQTRPSLRWPV